jgi:hypothetical protein
MNSLYKERGIVCIRLVLAPRSVEINPVIGEWGLLPKKTRWVVLLIQLGAQEIVSYFLYFTCIV